ncbi:MAG: type VII toxin-antitoxin system HepT family RNase toxin [Anaerolineae bacterium]
MIRREVLRRRLSKLDEYLKILRRLREYDLGAFLNDPEHYGSAERFLQLTIEALNDMGSHVIADLQLGMVESYRDVPRILVEHDYISSDLGDLWIQMIGFRNVLVHDYLDIDRNLVYRVLQENLEDINTLRRVFAQWL